MSKDLNIALLLDFYGDMLTEKQRETIELYYDDDLSLAEISETVHITRQGVRDSIKRGEMQLNEFENKLGLAAKFQKYTGFLDKMDDLAKDIYEESNTYNYSRDITTKAQIIREYIRQSKEII